MEKNNLVVIKNKYEWKKVSNGIFLTSKDEKSYPEKNVHVTM